MSRTHLIIPDSHAHPSHSNERFTWLGKLIRDIKPDVVVNIGDMADMVSLCHYEKGKASFEGMRYSKDIAVAVEANDRVWSEVRKAKKKQPRKIFTLGNHEERINRAIEQDAAQLQGVIGIEDLQLDHYGYETYPFLTPVDVDGVLYSHYFTSGVMSRPIGGEHMAYSLITKKLASCTQGHAHTRDFAERTTADGRKILGMSVGCYVDYEADYAGQANKMWWSGVVVKRNVEQGNYDHQWISMNQIKKEYI